MALTNIDEENVLLTLFAKKHSKGKLVTKINRLEFDDILAGLDLGSIVYPKYMTCDYIVQYVRALQNEAGNNIKTLYRILDDRVEALEFTVHEESRATGVPLSQLHLKKNLLLCCITRGDNILIPRGGDQIQVGDNVIVSRWNTACTTCGTSWKSNGGTERMNYAIVFRLLGYILMIEGTLLLLPAVTSLIYAEWAVMGVFLLTAAISGALGFALQPSSPAARCSICGRLCGHRPDAGSPSVSWCSRRSSSPACHPEPVDAHV